MNPPKKEKGFKKKGFSPKGEFKTKGLKKNPQKEGLKKGIPQRAKH